ncbi:MAG TPA: GIY-YIG nuclease family protein [Bacillota bacterium]|nr:GIY-YIG nuclease family protein [Bacillota bacterium]
MAERHTVYILKCKDDTLYTGYTNNLPNRLRMHEKGQGAKYTRGRGPFQVMFTQTFSTKRHALQKEYAIKQLSRQEKLQLIREQGKEGYGG